MRGKASALAAFLLLAPVVATAQDAGGASGGATVEVVQGGEPGVIRVAVAGTDLASAAEPAGALRVDPSAPLPVSFTLAPPEGVTWEVRRIVVGMVLAEGQDPPERLAQVSDWNSTIPPGFTVFVNQSMDLQGVQRLGVGLFRMQVAVQDDHGADLYRESFYVRVEGNPLLTAAGAAVTAATVATAYGLWSILNDLREVNKARERHRKKEARHGKLFKAADAAVALEDGLEGVADLAGDADAEAERLARRRRLAWPATGLGLGSVGVSWAQFLGHVPLDLGNALLVALGGAAALFSLALLATALARRWRVDRVVRVPVQAMDAPAREAKEPMGRVRP